MKGLIPEKTKAKVLFSTTFDGDFAGKTDGFLTLSVKDGPKDTWIGPEHTGISGAHTLCVEGKAPAGRLVTPLFTGLSVAVSSDTVFRYHIFPAFTGEHYDYGYTQMYFALRVRFSDGSIAELTDQNGNSLSAEAQGKSRTLYTHQWNQLYASMGEYAGKTVEAILLEYEKDADRDFCAYFDDVSVYDKPEDRRTRLCHWATIFRGTNDTGAFSRGLTTPAVTVPQGFSMYAPCTNFDTSKHYDYFSDNIICMSVSHEPSIWIGDRGTWQFMVNTSKNAACVKSAAEIETKSLKNIFSHDNETGHPHYYSVSFEDDGKDARDSSLEMTPACHGVAVRFTYGKTAANRSVIFDNHTGDSQVTFGADGSFVAYTDHKSNGSGRMFIYGRFDRIPVSTAVFGRSAVATFAPDTDEVLMTFATSYIDGAQAARNYEYELSGKSFEAICSEAADEWDKVFSCITDIKGARTEQKESVYSALYYLYKYPNIMSENTGTPENPVWKYRSPYSGKVEEGVFYINNGFWDTYRTAWSGYSLFSPDKLPALIDGFVRHYRDQGWVPRWSAPGGVNCMVGTSSDIIFADAMAKGFEFDRKGAYESAVKNGAVYPSDPRNGGRTRMERSVFLGYTPGSHEDFSWSIEGYINDYGIYRMATILAAEEKDAAKKREYLDAADYYMHRAMNYALLFCDMGEGTENKWFRGREADGSFTTANSHEGKYDPLFWGRDYTETDAYNMSVGAVFDGEGLASLYGSKAALAEKIDSILTTCDVYRGYGATDDFGGIHEQREMREVKLGRLGLSNQPSHHIIYMYNFTDEHYKTQKYVRDCNRRLFVGGRFGQGYPGDEDNGEMSCWYLFSCLGFYPLCVGSAEYTIGSPAFSEVTVKIGEKPLCIRALNNSDENIYIQSARFNGEPLCSCVITHEQLAGGGLLEFEMGSEPSDWAKGSAPFSLTAKGAEIEYREDLVPSDALFCVSDSFTSSRCDRITVSSDSGTVSAAFDNNSKTETVFSKSATVGISFPEPVNAQALTLTSPASEGCSLSRLTVLAAADGCDFVTLLDRKNICFEWAQYTKPFSLENSGSYSHYLIKFTSENDISLAEIELLGRK